jgi:ribonuclease P protein component
MLAKKHRLNLSLVENSQMFRGDSSQRFLSKNLLFYYRSNKVGLKVSALTPSRIFPKAHQRARFRRLLYNLIIQKNKEMKNNKQESLFNKNIDLIIVYKNDSFEESELREDLNTFFEKYETL